MKFILDLLNKIWEWITVKATKSQQIALALIVLCAVGSVLLLRAQLTIWQILIPLLPVVIGAWVWYLVWLRKIIFLVLLIAGSIAYVAGVWLAFTATKRSIDGMLAQAQALRMFGDYEGSHKILTKILAIPEGQRSNAQTITCLAEMGQGEIMLGDWPQAEKDLHECSAISIAHGSCSDRGNASLWLGELAGIQGDGERARSYLEEALRFYKDCNDKKGQADALFRLGQTKSVGAPDFTAAKADCSAANSLYLSIGDLVGQADVLRCYGDIENNLSQFDQALADYSKALQLYREKDNLPGQAEVLVKLGDMHTDLTNIVLATQEYTEGLALYKRVGSKLGQGNALSGLGDIAQKQGPNSVARKYYDEGLELFKSMNSTWGVASILVGKGIVETHQGELDEAAKDLKEAFDDYRGLGNKKGEGEVRVAMGDLELERGDFGRAKLHFDEALRIFGASTSEEEQASALRGRADVERALGGRLQAQGDYLSAKQICFSHKNERGQAIALKGLGLLELSDRIKASEFYDQAMKLYQRANDRRGQADIFKAQADLASKYGDKDLARKNYDLALSIYRDLEDGKKATEVERLMNASSNSNNPPN